MSTQLGRNLALGPKTGPDILAPTTELPFLHFKVNNCVTHSILCKILVQYLQHYSWLELQEHTRFFKTKEIVSLITQVVNLPILLS